MMDNEMTPQEQTEIVLEKTNLVNTPDASNENVSAIVQKNQAIQEKSPQDMIPAQDQNERCKFLGIEMAPKTRYIIKGVIWGTLLGVWIIHVFAPLCGAVVAYILWVKKHSEETPLTRFFDAILKWLKECVNPTPDAEDTAKQKKQSCKTKRSNKGTKETGKCSLEEDPVQLCIALWGICMAAAWSDGVRGDDEKQEAKDLLDKPFSHLDSFQKKKVLEKLQQFQKDFPKPSFDDAIREIEKLNKVDYEIFDSAIQRIICADENIAQEEKLFTEQWEKYKSNHKTNK